MLLLVSSPLLSLVSSSLWPNAIVLLFVLSAFAHNSVWDEFPKNASQDIETESVVTPDIQRRPRKHNPPHLHMAFERLKKAFAMLTHALSPQIYVNALLRWMGWAASLHPSVASPLHGAGWIMGVLVQWLNWKLRKKGKEEGGENTAGKMKMLFDNYLIPNFPFWVNLRNFVWHETQYFI